MKKWQIGICITCAVVLAGMLFSTVAQAARTTASTVRGHIEIFDVQQNVMATCIQHSPSFNKLLDAVELDKKNLAARLSEQATAALLQQGLLVIELPGHARRVSYAPADTNSQLIGAIGE